MTQQNSSENSTTKSLETVLRRLIQSVDGGGSLTEQTALEILQAFVASLPHTLSPLQSRILSGLVLCYPLGDMVYRDALYAYVKDALARKASTPSSPTPQTTQAARTT